MKTLVIHQHHGYDGEYDIHVFPRSLTDGEVELAEWIAKHATVDTHIEDVEAS